MIELGDPTVTAVVFAAWAVNEALSLIPSVKSNGVFQLAYNLLRKLVGKRGETNDEE